MDKILPIQIKPEIKKAFASNQPIVALETTVLTHGLPFDINLQNALKNEEIIRQNGAIPATIGLIDGIFLVGLTQEEIHFLATSKNVHKISIRDIGYAIANKLSGGTTVAGTLKIASTVGIKVFATGGIGGVHRGGVFDVSADIEALAKYPVITVCAGAKAILDLESTLEVLETKGIPVIGYQTNELPAFYSISSGIEVPLRAETIQEIANTALQHWNIGLTSAILVTAPPPKEYAIENRTIEEAIQKALISASENGIRGNAVTPFLLSEVSKVTHEQSMRVNLALLENNASIAAQIAVQLFQESV